MDYLHPGNGSWVSLHILYLSEKSRAVCIELRFGRSGLCKGAAVVCNASRQLMRPRFRPRTPTSASDVASFELPASSHLVHRGWQAGPVNCFFFSFFLPFFSFFPLLSAHWAVCALGNQGTAAVCHGQFAGPKFPGQFQFVLFLALHPSLSLPSLSPSAPRSPSPLLSPTVPVSLGSHCPRPNSAATDPSTSFEETRLFHHHRRHRHHRNRVCWCCAIVVCL